MVASPPMKELANQTAHVGKYTGRPAEGRERSGLAVRILKRS